MVAITDVETPERAAAYGSPLGSKVYTIEYGDGSSTNVAASWVEFVESSPEPGQAQKAPPRDEQRSEVP